MEKKNIAILLCGGVGKRFGNKIPKQLCKLDGRTILDISLTKLLDSNLFCKIFVVAHDSIIDDLTAQYQNKKIRIIKGGKERQNSVFNALKKSQRIKPDNVIIHDSVRPFFSRDLLKQICQKLKKNDSVIPVLHINDSLRFKHKDKYKDINRNNHFLIQTPQGFNFKKIYDAYKKINDLYSDDSIIAYNGNIKIYTINGERDNLKITTIEDYEFCKKRLMNTNITRVGSGFDVHNLVPGNFLIIFGIKIPFDKRLEGHSDADVGFHSIVDSILGALGKGDIGDHFPPSQNKWRNKESSYFLKHSYKILKKEGWIINNLDLTLICEKPKITVYKEKMIENIKDILSIEKEKINIKATTTEKLGFIGRNEGIACQSIVSISKENVEL